MIQEIVNIFRTTGEVNGKNQVNGIISLRFGLIAFICLVSLTSRAQEFVEAKVVKILSTNSFLIEESEDTIKVQINDTESISANDEKYGEGIDYLNKHILNKKIFFKREDSYNRILQVSIIYDCLVKNKEGIYGHDALPCANASFLDLELIQRRYVKYLGNNEFLKKNNNLQNNFASPQALAIIEQNKRNEIFIGYLDFKMISGLKKKIDGTTEDLKEVGCEGWILENENVRDILKNMRKVEANEWYSLCYQYPCNYTCNVRNGETKYVMSINGASYIQLSNAKETLIFILETESESFITPCNCCEEE